MPYINNYHAGLAILLVLLAALPAALFDVRTRRIPNVLVAALFAAGLALNALGGIGFVATDLAIVGAVLLLGSVAFSLKFIGGGDIKLLAAAAGTLGYPSAVPFVLFTFLAGGIIALLVSMSCGTLKATFANVRGLTLPLIAGMRPARLQTGTSMPYALAICAGALLTLVTGGLVPHLRF